MNDLEAKGWVPGQFIAEDLLNLHPYKYIEERPGVWSIWVPYYVEAIRRYCSGGDRFNSFYFRALLSEAATLDAEHRAAAETAMRLGLSPPRALDAEFAVLRGLK